MIKYSPKGCGQIGGQTALAILILAVASWGHWCVRPGEYVNVQGHSQEADLLGRARAALGTGPRLGLTRVAYFEELAQGGPLGGRSRVCLHHPAAKAALPPGDVAAGCRFPQKSPGKGSREALHTRCGPWCDQWQISSLPALEEVARWGLWVFVFRMKDCHPRSEIPL